jgi:predicted RNA binding protein with dsRBD fold (UPF0201 family)
MMYRIDVEVIAPVNDTEVTERVVTAVENLVPGAEVERASGEVRAETHSLDHFSELLHEQEILDSARSEFFADRRGDVVSVALKKQAAFEGVVNFAVGEPDELGDITLQIRVHEPSVEEYIDHVAPPTEDGAPVTDRP